MTLAFELDLDRVKTDQYAKTIQFESNCPVTLTQTNTQQINCALPGPLK